MSIKLNRAQQLADVGKFPQTWQAIISNFPESLLVHGTASMIADVADAMRISHNIGYNAGLKDGNPGTSTSELKANAARENGKKGGRPRKTE